MAPARSGSSKGRERRLVFRDSQPFPGCIDVPEYPEDFRILNMGLVDSRQAEVEAPRCEYRPSRAMPGRKRKSHPVEVPQRLAMDSEMVAEEAGDKVVAVVVALLVANSGREVGLAAGLFQQFGL